MTDARQASLPRTSHETVAADATAAVGDSLTVAVWTVISRVTGVLRGVTVAAVLGATFFANTYQFTNSLPNLVYYGFLGGVLFTSLLVPALVRHIDTGDSQAAARVAGGFFGLVVSSLVLAVPMAVLIASTVTNQSRVGTLLILMLMPQVPLYAVVGSASAVMNAHRRFALAAAAPAAENIGTIVVLGLVAVLYPRTAGSAGFPLGMLLLLGLGTTGAVGLHAALQWWGARRVGITLVPRAGWRDPEVRAIVRRAVPSLIQAGLQALQLLVLLIIANRVAGGVVAFQLAMNFYFLPIALAATPVALSLAPRLSRLTAVEYRTAFRDTYLRGLAFALFLAVPAAAGYLALAGPLANAVSFGGFGTGGGPALVAAALAGLAIGVVAETVFMVTTYACYARTDTVTPLRAMVVQVSCGLGFAWLALLVDGPAVLLILGIALSAGGVVSAGYLSRKLLRGLDADDHTTRLGVPLLRIILVSVAMAPVSWAVAAAARIVLPESLPVGVRGLLSLAVAVPVGAAVYFGLQSYLRAPELAWATGAMRLSRVRALVGRLRRRPNGRARQPYRGLLVKLGLLVVCVPAGVAVGIAPELALLGLAAVAVIAVVVVRPAAAAYLLIVLTPLTAGIDRGMLVPLLRPNEALAMLVGVGLVLHWLFGARSGALRLPKLDRLDAVLIGLAVCNSVVPIAAMLVRRDEVTADDLQHAIVLWKYLAVYGLVRYAVRTQRAVMRCVWLSVLVGAFVCVVGILQALGLFGIPNLLATLYAPFGVERTLDIGRGGSTLALPAAVADLAILNLALAVALILRGSPHRRWLGLLAIVCAFGVGAAGEFSSLFGLIVAVLALIVVTGSGRLLRYVIPVGLIGGIALWPVIQGRLAGFESASGIPESWLVRYYNLTTYFWPDLFANGNWLFGVRPAARVPAAHEEFGWVWIESGHTWLLWAGGVPLLAAYACFVWVALRRSWFAARESPGLDSYGIVGIAVFAVVAADIVLMVFDPHLTYRGAADAMYILLALLRPMPVPVSAHPEFLPVREGSRTT